MIPVPGYIDPDAWSGFCEMRASMGKSKPFTVRAAKLVLYELHRLKEAGHCPNAALDQSTLHGWADVYEPKDKPITATRKSDADRTKAWLAQEAEHAAKVAAQRAMRKAQA